MKIVELISKIANINQNFNEGEKYQEFWPVKKG